MKRILIITALVLTAIAMTSCRTTEVGTGKIIEESICSWEIHADLRHQVCWVESWYQDHNGKTRLVLPVPCEVATDCYCRLHACPW